MRQYRICGGKRISGELAIGGAKNAVLPILAAACLNKSETTIHNCPRISDAFDTIKILEGIGFGVEFLGNTLKIHPAKELSHEVPDECATKMRSSILFMGALLGQTGKVNLALPGGCNLGERAIDLHIKGLEAMGAKIHQEGNKLFCETEKQGLCGTKIKLDTASVGATENLLIAATKAKGETVIENAAREPEVVDLAQFLKKMGAKIRGAGTGTIAISGTGGEFNKEITHEIIPDRIVAGTYLVAAAMTGGYVRLTNVRPFDLAPFTMYLSEMGCTLRASHDTVILHAPQRLRPAGRIVTKVHPGFPTDMQAQFAAALSIAEKRSEITETIFEGRSSHVQELRKMGANIHLTADKQTFVIDGVRRLHGATVAAHDLRCGAALILAALAADGETIVQNAEFVERGYESIENDLTALGADIRPETI
ncbi:MAG: UDP-N-acetylglucosamine 1-carboxyvinyltransferase [Defluviitaleaceae bacterium]|nr:UDP-N-acetylglucosamine 1-carboxyvinyltransferase [Defluviitaleaceae bacterium]MCL2262827.1 UDP-N-acetylglucosamine 1-carboxyvinyltransferase [Defluviitaleaceae bacterium]